MNKSTRTFRRLVRGLGLALAVVAAATPGAQAASKGDYGIESFRVQGTTVGTYDAIEALRGTRLQETGSPAYDAIEIARRVSPQPATERPYDAIELVRAQPSRVVERLPYDGIELTRSQSPLEAAPSALVSAAGFDWGDAGAGAGFGLAISLVVGSAAVLVTRRRTELAPS
jgi:hypothetical protein